MKKKNATPVIILEGASIQLLPNKKYECDGCGNMFLGKDLRPYRYEPSRPFCLDCELDKEHQDELDTEEMNLEEEDN